MSTAPAPATPDRRQQDQDEIDRLIEQFDPESNFRRLVGLSAGFVTVVAPVALLHAESMSVATHAGVVSVSLVAGLTWHHALQKSRHLPTFVGARGQNQQHGHSGQRQPVDAALPRHEQRQQGVWTAHARMRPIQGEKRTRCHLVHPHS